MQSAASYMAQGVAVGVVQTGARMVESASGMVDVALPKDPLEAFASVSSLVVKQKVDKMEAAANLAAAAVGLGGLGNIAEQANTYNVYSNTGGLAFNARERSEHCPSGNPNWCDGRALCAPNHSLQLLFSKPGIITKGADMMLIDRPCYCGQCCACFDCCLHKAELYSAGPDGAAAVDPALLVASVRQPIGGGGFSPTLEVMDREGANIATVTGPCCCVGGNCFDNTFTIVDAQGAEIGQILKKKPDDFQDALKQGLTDADNFTLSVKPDLDSKVKAALMTSLLMLDYEFFEGEGDVTVNTLEGSCSYKCCDMYCFGASCPCKCTCGGGQEHH